MDRAGSVRSDEFIELAAQRLQIRPHLGRTDMVFLTDAAHPFPFRGLLQDVKGHQRCSRIKMQDAVGVDDQSAVTVGVKPQMDAALLVRVLATIMIHAGFRVLHHLFSSEPVSQ